MATTVTPQFIQVSNYFNAVDLRDAANKPAWEGVREGIAQYSHLLTTAGSGGNLSVDVSAGVCYVRGDSQIDQGLYRCEFDTDNNLPLSTADATHPRVDRIVVTVRDSTYDASGYYEAKLQVRTGTPTSGATLANLTGAQALTDSEILIADVLVNAGATAPSSINTKTRSLCNNSSLFLPSSATVTVRANTFSLEPSRQAMIGAGSSLVEYAPFLNKYGELEAPLFRDPSSASERFVAVGSGTTEYTSFYPVLASETIEAVDTIAYVYDTAVATFGWEFAIFDKFGQRLASTTYFEDSSGSVTYKELALSASFDVVAGELYYIGCRMYSNLGGITIIRTPTLYGNQGNDGTNAYVCYRRGEVWARATTDTTRSSVWSSVDGLSDLDTAYNEIAIYSTGATYKVAPTFAITYGK